MLSIVQYLKTSIWELKYTFSPYPKKYGTVQFEILNIWVKV